jgi:hypothetical protein
MKEVNKRIKRDMKEEIRMYEKQRDKSDKEKEMGYAREDTGNND